MRVSVCLYLWGGKPADPAAVWNPEQEAKSLISQRSFNPRDVFKQREQSFEANGSPSASRPGTQHKADISFSSSMKLITSAPPPGKLQSPFLSQKWSPQQPRSPPAAAALARPVSPPSTPQSNSHPTVATPTPPESTSSLVPAAGQSKTFLNAPA